MKLLPFGEAALFVELEQGIAVDVAARAAAIAESWERRGAGTAIPAYASVVLRFDPLALDRGEAERIAREAVKDVESGRAASITREVTIATRYDGPDLAEVAELSALRVDEVVAIHSAARYRAYFVGWLPGWAYLGPLDPRIRAPRRPTPRQRVPAGSVAVIDGQTGIYPYDAPGGWRLIGRTDARLFDPGADQPSLIRTGDTVRFVPT
ncbi:MAG: 5-oxoprolinase subunit PxpB [Chloroflexi bacterium]|nr:5-oxoprolinase subunit PxpB [Chloroflexota bacterium]